MIYNLNLLKMLGIEEDHPEFSFTVTPEAEKTIEEMFKSLGIEKNNKVIALHPGSGGSAPVWPLKNFSLLSDKLIKSGYTVILSGGEDDKSSIDKVISACKKKPFVLPGYLNLKELAAFLKTVDLFVANSTGPLHLARALGTIVLGFYSPLTSSKAQRWGPFGKEDQFLAPEVPECKKCTEKNCTFFDCMESITPNKVYNKVKSLVKDE